MQLADVASLRVTVMGLGLHGGGLASALYFARAKNVAKFISLSGSAISREEL